MRYIVVFLGAVIVGLGIYVLSPLSDENRDFKPLKLSSSYGFNKDIERVYSLNSSSDILIYTDPSNVNKDSFSLDASLNFRVLKKMDSKIITLFQLSSIDLKSSNEILNKELKKLYSDMFVVVFSDKGEILNRYFKYKDDDYKGICQILSIIQTVVKDEKKYRYLESNYDGVVAVEYEREADNIKRKREIYVSVKDDYLDYEIKDSNIDISIDKHWIKNLDANETITVYEDKQKLLTSKNRYVLREDSALYDPSLEIWQFDGDLDDLINRYSKKKKQSYFKKIKQEQQKEYFQNNNLDVESLLDNIESYDDYAALKKLEDFITLYPEKAVYVYEYIKTAEDKLSAHLINVLENSGTPEAQELLVKIASSDEFEHVDHLRGIVALGGVENPNDKSIEYLWERYGMREEKLDSELSNTAILSIGVLASKSEKESEIKQRIKDSYYDSQSVSQKRALLLSMQNAGAKGFKEEIYESLEDKNNYVKSTAVKALKSIDGQDNREKLYELFDQNEERKVRKSVVSTLRSIDADENLMIKARENLFLEQDNLIRKELIYYLLENKKKYPQNIDTLREFRKHEKDRDNKILLRNEL